jgi:hypothetical protein
MAVGLRTRTRRILAVGVVSALAALGCAIANSGIIGGFPPKLRLNHLQIAAATSHVNVDMESGRPPLVQLRGTPPADVRTLTYRAELLGRVMVSQPVLERIEKRCGIRAGQLSGLGRTTANVPIALIEPDSERRASEIRASKTPFRLEMQSRPLLPVIDVYTQAPTVEGATCVADAAPLALAEYMRSLALEQRVSVETLASLQPLGPARGSVTNGGAAVTIAMLTFVTVFGLCFGGLLGIGRWRRWSSATPRPLPASEPEDTTDLWPHTTRLLPWMFAGFLGLIWLTPFNNIEIDVTLPIELRLDRLVLPILVFVWILALGAGARIAPRLRMTWVHLAIAGLLACAFLSVVVDARYLNQSLELDLSLKKLPLMLSYATLFLIASSAVRRGEVQSFMTYTLVLAIIVALGMILEYRMMYNPFWSLSDKLLPGFFSVEGTVAGDAIDHLGRRVVSGPAELGLEAVAMLSMALPVALVRVLHEPRTRQRLLYSLAIIVLVAAALATYRKSALIVPVGVVCALAYFRRRELLRLAPLGMVTLIIVSTLAPGAIGSTVRQFTRSDATSVPTVSDRASDYDAIRPDVWSHILLGRGWGSYNHDSYRILDSEILLRIIETGVLGLLAFILVGVSAVAASRKVIAARDPETAPIALVTALVAVAFLIAALLFDELSFPHATYIFLYMVGLGTVVLPRCGEASAPPPAPVALDVPPPHERLARAPAVQEQLVPVR